MALNEASKRKSSMKTRLKATSQEERIQLWKQHFENLPGKPPKIMHEPITKIISNQLFIKQVCLHEEPDLVQRQFLKRGAAVHDEAWKTTKFDCILLRHCKAVCKETTIKSRTKECIIPFPKKINHGIAKNYRGIILTSLAAKTYNALLRNHIK